jgi:hypothetical protein
MTNLAAKRSNPCMAWNRRNRFVFGSVASQRIAAMTLMKQQHPGM